MTPPKGTTGKRFNRAFRARVAAVVQAAGLDIPPKRLAVALGVSESTIYRYRVPVRRKRPADAAVVARLLERPS